MGSSPQHCEELYCISRRKNEINLKTVNLKPLFDSQFIQKSMQWKPFRGKGINLVLKWGSAERSFGEGRDYVSPILSVDTGRNAFSYHFILFWYSVWITTWLCALDWDERSRTVKWLKTYQIISAYMLERIKARGKKGEI